MPWLRLLVVTAFPVLAACVTQTVTLPDHDANVPEGVDLSGQWRLTDGGEPTTPPPDALVRVFLEFGKSLKITQTEFGLFVSFDRAVVEEYRFGEQREVSVGPIEAQRSSGWEGRSYIIETLDRDRVRLAERYRLDARSEALLRIVEIWRGEKRLYHQQQVFARN